MALVIAPGRMRKGIRLELVTSRTKKFSSLPATSQAWGVKPLVPSCRSCTVGVLPLTISRSTAGTLVPMPTWPSWST